MQMAKDESSPLTKVVYVHRRRQSHSWQHGTNETNRRVSGHTDLSEQTGHRGITAAQHFVGNEPRYRVTQDAFVKLKLTLPNGPRQTLYRPLTSNYIRSLK
jgi:hypothetical protein